MKLLTKEISRKMPTIMAAVNQEDPDVLLKFFTPDGGWTWYAIGADACLWCEETQSGMQVSLEEMEDRFGWLEVGQKGRGEEGRIWELEDIRFTGFVKGLEEECGDFSLKELQGVRGKLGLPIERDRWWSKEPLSRVMAGQTN